MNRQYLTKVLGLGLVASLVLSACAPVAPAGSGAAAPAPAEAPAAEAAQPEKVASACNVAAPSEAVEVNMIGWSFPIMDFYASELEKCGEVENITVNTQLLDSTGAREQVNLALSGGGVSPFTIIHGANGDISTWGSQGYLAPINDLVEKYWDQYNLGDIPEAAWAGATFEGNIYGVPIVANTLHLMYRPDLFEKYSLTVPTNYDEVITACSALKDEESIDLPFTMNLHAGWAWEIEFLHFLRSFGGDHLDADNQPVFNSAEGVAALTKMKEVVDACMGPEGITYSVDDSEIGMETGKLAFMHMWASRAANMDNPEKSEFVGKIEFAPAAAPNPGGKLGGSAWNDFYMIPATSEVDLELAFQIIMEAADLESQKEAATLGIVTRAAVGKEGIGGRYTEAASNTIVNGVGIYATNPAVGLARAALGNNLPLVGTGEMTPQEALDKAAADYTTEATAQGFIK